ncbi:hypothetical protein THAOC_27067, partial [Thalassiosira oceanica]
PAKFPFGSGKLQNLLALLPITDFSNTLKNTLPVFFNDCIEHKQHPGINWTLNGLRRQNRTKCKLVYQGIVNLAAPHEERYFDYRSYVGHNLATRVEWTNMRNTIVGRLGVLYQRTLASRMLVAKKVLAGQNADEYEPTGAEIKREIGNKKLFVGALGSYADRVFAEENKAKEGSNKRRRSDSDGD